MRSSRAEAVVFGGYLVFLYAIAVFFFRSEDGGVNAEPFRTMVEDWRTGGRPLVVNFVGNLVAFMPMGAVPSRLLWGRLRWRWWHAGVFGLGFSLLIEGSQLYSGRRCADVDDLILNTAGAMLGFALLGGVARPHCAKGSHEE